MKRHWWLLAVICFAILIRVLYFLHSPLYQTTGDSVSYFLTGKSLIETRTVNDPWRTPVYPLILALPYILEGRQMPDNISSFFMPELWIVRIAQSVAGVFTVILIYLLLLRLKFPQWAAGVYGILIACNYAMVMYEHNILTESFSSFWLAAAAYLTVRLLSRFDGKKFMALALLWVVGVFLRPSFIEVPGIITMVLILKHLNWRMAVWATIAMMSYTLVLYGYSHANAIRYNYNGISRIADVNLWGKILTLRLSTREVADASGIKIILESMNEVEETDPWPFFKQYPQLFTPRYAGPFASFVRSVVIAHLGEYIIGSSKNIPVALVDRGVVRDVTATTGRFDGLFRILKRVSFYGMYLNWALFVALPVFAYEAWKKKTVFACGMLLFTLIGLYHLFAAVYLSYNDYGRLILPSVPLMYIPSLVIWYRGGKSIYQFVTGILPRSF